MRERLIDLLKKPLQNHENSVAYWNDEHIGELADCLLKNGVVVLPVKVGDKVWEHEWETVGTDAGSFEFIHAVPSVVEKFFVGTSEDIHLLENFGKTVFLTREAAEQALKER